MECISDTEISEGDKLMLFTRIISLERIQKDADEKRKTLILLFSPAFILKIQKKYTQPRFLGVKKGVNLVTT